MYDPLTEISQRLQGRNLSEVARRAGMAYDNVHRLAHRRQDDIYIRTYVKLLKVLDEMDASKRGWDDCEAVQHSDQMVCRRCDVVWDAGDPDGPVDCCGLAKG